MIKIIDSKIISSGTCLKETINTNLPEFVMIGRSNVGKSSFINTLCNRKNLAYVGKSPGKTRLINLYQLNNDFVLTDLPGYGYAKTSQTEQSRWKSKIEEYLLQRKQIISIIQLVDARHDIQKNDLQMNEWIDYNKIPSFVILTKSDYVNKAALIKKSSTLEKNLGKKIFIFSAKEKTGRLEILKHLVEIINPKTV